MGAGMMGGGMMGGWGYPFGMGWGFTFVGMLIPLLFVVLVVVGAYFLLSPRREPVESQKAITILDERYAFRAILKTSRMPIVPKFVSLCHSKMLACCVVGTESEVSTASKKLSFPSKKTYTFSSANCVMESITSKLNPTVRIMLDLEAH